MQKLELLQSYWRQGIHIASKKGNCLISANKRGKHEATASSHTLSFLVICGCSSNKRENVSKNNKNVRDEKSDDGLKVC